MDGGEEQVQEGRGAEDWIPESTGTAVLHAGWHKAIAQNAFCVALRARHASTEASTATCFHADAKANRCLHRAVVAHVSGRPANHNHHPWWWYPNGRMICGADLKVVAKLSNESPGSS